MYQMDVLYRMCVFLTSQVVQASFFHLQYIQRRVLQAYGLYKIWAVSFEDEQRLTVLDFGAATSRLANRMRFQRGPGVEFAK